MKKLMSWLCGVGVATALMATSYATSPAYGHQAVSAPMSGFVEAGKATLTPQATLLATTAVATNTVGANWRAQLPKDEKGRVIGGENFPVINYSPTMITGKPCPRVTKWTFKVIQTKAGKIGISDDPCVVQNAVDDVVRTLYFSPSFHDPKTFKAIAKQAAIDPAVLLGVEVHLRTSLLENYYNGKTSYNRCNKPNYFLLNIDAKTPITANNDGTVTGSRMHITFLRATADVQPFKCEFVTYGENKVVGKYEVTRAMVSGSAMVTALGYDLFWNSATNHWMVLKIDGIPFPKYADTVKALWATSPLKPE